jgi:opacity protein-like surface antigen
MLAARRCVVHNIYKALWSPVPSSAAFGAFPAAGNTGGSSAIGGFQVGYNWQFAPTWVAGIEGDWSWANAGSSFNQPWVVNPGGAAVSGSFTSMSSTLDWVSSLRARLGYLVLPNLMAYGTAGGAWGGRLRCEQLCAGHTGVRHEHRILQHPRGFGWLVAASNG